MLDYLRFLYRRKDIKTYKLRKINLNNYLNLILEWLDNLKIKLNFKKSIKLFMFVFIKLRHNEFYAFLFLCKKDIIKNKHNY